MVLLKHRIVQVHNPSYSLKPSLPVTFSSFLNWKLIWWVMFVDVKDFQRNMMVQLHTISKREFLWCLNQWKIYGMQRKVLWRKFMFHSLFIFYWMPRGVLWRKFIFLSLFIFFIEYQRKYFVENFIFHSWLISILGKNYFSPDTFWTQFVHFTQTLWNIKQFYHLYIQEKNKIKFKDKEFQAYISINRNFNRKYIHFIYESKM